MEEQELLELDNKGIFLKMFKRRFKNEFNFFEESFLLKNENDAKKYDRSIFVVYDKTELLDFFRLNKKGKNVLVCLFNKELYNGSSFLNEIRNLIILDNTKTRPEIINELKLHFADNFSTDTKEESYHKVPIFQSRFQNFYKALFFLM